MRSITLGDVFALAIKHNNMHNIMARFAKTCTVKHKMMYYEVFVDLPAFAITFLNATLGSASWPWRW